MSSTSNVALGAGLNAMVGFVIPVGTYIAWFKMMNDESDEPKKYERTWYIFAALLTAMIILGYLSHLTFLSAIQAFSCGAVYDMRSLAIDALIVTLISVSFFLMGWFVPIVFQYMTALFPEEMEDKWKDAIGFGLFSLWGSAYGISYFGFPASFCGDGVKTVIAPPVGMNSTVTATE